MDDHVDSLESEDARRCDALRQQLAATDAERRRLEEALARSEQEARYAAQFPAENPNPVLRVGCDGALLYANPASAPLLRDWAWQPGLLAPQLCRDLAAQAFDTRAVQHIDVESDGRIYAFDVVPIAHGGYANLYGTDITDRKQAEMQRQAALDAAGDSEARFRSLADGLPQLVWVIDARGNWLYGNRAWRDYVGGPVETLEERESLLHPEDRPRVVELWVEAIRGGSTFECEYRLRRHDGEYRWFLARSVIERTAAGDVLGWTGTATDIHEQKQAEEMLEEQVRRRTAELHAEILERRQAESHREAALEALRAALAYNRSLIEASLDPLVTIGPDGKITDVNVATEAATGVSRARLVGSDFSTYFTEPERASAGYRRVLAEGQVRDYALTISHADGHTIDVLYNATVYRNEAGVVQGVFAAARDVTERKRAEAELERYRAHLEEMVQERTAELDAVFNSASSGLMFYGPDSRIVRVNPAGEALLGYSAATHDVPFSERVRRMRIEGADGRLMAFDQLPAVRAFRGETVHGLPMALFAHGPQQPPTWVMASAAPVRAADGTILGVVSTFSDVTELRRAQESLEAANERLMEQAAEMEVQAEELLAQNQELTSVMADLQTERSRLEVILRRMPAGVAIVEAPSGRLTLYNDAMERIWRQRYASAGELDAWISGHLLHPDGRPVSVLDLPSSQALATGQGVPDREFEIMRGDDTRGTVSIGAAPILDRSGQVTAVVMVVHDVTEHRDLELALRRTRDELAALLAGSAEMASTLDVEALLSIVADRLQQMVPHTGLAVYRLAEDGRTLEVAARRGEGKPSARSMPVGQAVLLNEVMATGRPVLIPDMHDESAKARLWQSAAHPVQRSLLGRARCWLGVPLAVKDRVVGVLRLVHDQPGRFTEHDAELAMALAGHAALAMENTRLYEQAGKMAVLEERQRLARDLHDAVSQTLFSASLVADVLPRLWQRDPAQAMAKLEELKALTRGARAEMRTLLWELRPETLLQARFDQLVQHLGEAIAARVPIQVVVTAQGATTALPGDAQVALYRIVQEALNNVVKHSDAEHVTIDLSWQADVCGVEIHIEDDGRGFDPDAVSSERMGLKIMRERARDIGAALVLLSHPGAGTQLTLTWPAV